MALGRPQPAGTAFVAAARLVRRSRDAARVGSAAAERGSAV
jgi:hypothetical protein